MTSYKIHILVLILFPLFRGAFRYIRLLLLVYYYQKLNLTVPQAFAKTVKSHENKTAIIFEDQAWTFKDLEEYSNRVANYFLRAGYKPGQCIALFMENRYSIYISRTSSYSVVSIKRTGCNKRTGWSKKFI